MMNIYMAGSISDSPDDGRGWRTELTKSRENVNFLNPLDEHDPRKGNYERSDIVPDDLSLLDRADGILLKYEHGTNCWGTPSEQGYALCVNRRTDDSLPVVVWWDELGPPQCSWSGVDTTHELKDASPWLTDPACSIGVFWDRDKALSALLSEIGGPHHDCTKTAQNDSDPHGFLPEFVEVACGATRLDKTVSSCDSNEQDEKYVTPVSDYRGVVKK